VQTTLLKIPVKGIVENVFDLYIRLTNCFFLLLQEDRPYKIRCSMNTASGVWKSPGMIYVQKNSGNKVSHSIRCTARKQPHGHR